MSKGLTVLGLDPGLNRTGWGLVGLEGTRLSHLAHGVITTLPSDPLPTRLATIFAALNGIVRDWKPGLAAVEETFVNQNPSATLKLNHARTVALLVPALNGIVVESYAPNHVKKAVVGTGHAQKDQVRMMVKTLLPGARIDSADSADALAVAICHAHHAGSGMRLKTGTGG